LEDITKEKEKYQKYSSEKEAKITSSLNTRIANATKALTNIQGGSEEETKEVTEQAEQQLTPKQEKEKKRLEKLITNLSNELNGISRGCLSMWLLMKIPCQVCKEVMQTLVTDQTVTTISKVVDH